MAVVPGKNKLKMGSAGRYYGAYLIYDVANSCLAALHAKVPPTSAAAASEALANGFTRTSPPSPVHVQNPRKFYFCSFECYSIFFSKIETEIVFLEIYFDVIEGGR